VLAYLDALIAALTVRDHAEVERLLAHPLARILPEEAQREVQAFGSGACDPLAAPLRVMQLRHTTAELLRDVPEVADREVADRAVAPAVAESAPRAAAAGDAALRAANTRRPPRLVQMELPLSA